MQRENESFEEDSYFAEIESEMLQQLYNEIDRLPRKCKSVFKLIYMDGLKTDEVAKQLEINK